MSRSEDRIGKIGQEHAAGALRRAGVNMVEKIGTPVKLIAMGTVRGRKVYQVIYGEKVSGDHRGILDDGTSVLAETKTIMDRNLAWSDLREHQPGRLDEHAEHGGVSLLVWVHNTGAYVLLWPIADFGPRKSITPEKADNLNVLNLRVMASKGPSIDEMIRVGAALNVTISILTMCPCVSNATIPEREGKG